MLGTSAVGIDLGSSAEAPIDYRRYDGARFPAPDKSFDAVLLCYVLHHAQDVSVVLKETRRVLRDGGLVVIYEDIPSTWWAKVCAGFTISSGAVAPGLVRSARCPSGERSSNHLVLRLLVSGCFHVDVISRIRFAGSSLGCSFG